MAVTQTRAPARSGSGRQERRITRPRGLPGGRAVVGALLIAASAVVVFAAYLDATADPATRFLVAADPVASGTVIEDLDAARELFSSAPLTLVDAVAEHAVAVDDLESIVGHTLVAPLQRGELLQRSVLLDGERAAGGHVMSFSLPAADAVAGSLVPGETIDVLATSRGSRAPTTSYIVRGVPLLAVSTGGSGSNVVLTVALGGVDEVQALGHAVHTATVFVVSTTATEGPDGGSLPAPFVGEQLLDDQQGSLGDARGSLDDQQPASDDQQAPPDRGSQGARDGDDGGRGGGDGVTAGDGEDDDG